MVVGVKFSCGLWGLPHSHSGILCLPSPHLDYTGPEDRSFPNSHRGAVGVLLGPEAWLL